MQPNYNKQALDLRKRAENWKDGLRDNPPFRGDLEIYMQAVEDTINALVTDMSDNAHLQDETNAQLADLFFGDE